MKPKIIFNAAAGAMFKAKDAQKIGETLSSISERNGGQIKPEMIVREAKSEDNFLHPYFEWDDTRAASLYRIEQARDLICHILIVKQYNDDEKRLVNAFHSVITHENGRAYVPLEIVLGDKDYHQQKIRDAITEIKHWQEKYRNLKELGPIFIAIERVQGKLFPGGVKSK